MTTEDLFNKVCILGTCRIGNLYNCSIFIDRAINPYIISQTSRLYIDNNSGTKIITQPINYTTKLADIRDVLLYLQGKIYSDINPNLDETFFNIFFRGIHKYSFDNRQLKLPGEIIEGINNDFSSYIFEVSSCKEIIFNTKKYGDVYLGNNLPWNVDIGENNTIMFDKNDFVIYNDIERSKKILYEINELCKNRPILIIGPYLLKKDTNIKTSWGEETDILDLEFVNNSRKSVQDMLKCIVSDYENIDYFDMTEYVLNDDILEDQYHFNNIGRHLLTTKILDFIKKNKA